MFPYDMGCHYESKSRIIIMNIYNEYLLCIFIMKICQ